MFGVERLVWGGIIGIDDGYGYLKLFFSCCVRVFGGREFSYVVNIKVGIYEFDDGVVVVYGFV